MKPGFSQYIVHLNEGIETESSVEFPVLNRQNDLPFKLKIITLDDGAFRVKLNEASPLMPRYEVEHALLPGLSLGR